MTKGKSRSRYWTLVSSHTMNDFQTGAVAAMLPYFVSEEHYTYAAVAGFTTASTALSAVSQPVFGLLADRFGMRWLTLAGLLTSAIGVALTGLTAANYWLTWALIAIAGIGAAAFHPPATVGAKISGGGTNRALSTFSTGGNLGVAIAPLGVGLTVGTLGLQATPLMLLPTVAVAYLLLRVDRQRSRTSTAAEARLGARSTLPLAPDGRGLQPGEGNERSTDEPLRGHTDSSAQPGTNFGRRTVVEGSQCMVVIGGSHAAGRASDKWQIFFVLLLAIAFWSLSYIGTRSFIALRAITQYGIDDNAGTVLLGVYAFCGAGGTLCGGFLADRFGRLRVLPVGYIAGAVLTLAFLVMPNFPTALVVAGALGFVVFMPFSLHTTLSHSYLPRHLATASGATLGMSMTVGGLLTPVFGWVADRFGIAVDFWIFAAALLVGVAILLLLTERKG